jgi:hypothetical protein
MNVRIPSSLKISLLTGGTGPNGSGARGGVTANLFAAEDSDKLTAPPAREKKERYLKSSLRCITVSFGTFATSELPVANAGGVNGPRVQTGCHPVYT